MIQRAELAEAVRLVSYHDNTLVLTMDLRLNLTLLYSMT